jgi:multidrug efflux pump subunit AcrB
MDVLEKKAEIEAMQAELQAEMDRIKEEAEQAEEIERVKKQAQTYLNQDAQRVISKGKWVQRRFDETNNINVKIKKGTVELKRNASSYRINDNEIIETYTKEIEELSLVYVNPFTKGEYEIRIDENGGMELPYSVADSYRTYKRISTVVSKIEEYISNQNYKRAKENAQETANEAAVNYLEEKYPNSTVTYKKGWYRNPYDRHGGGLDTHEVTVKHTNGISVVMNIYTSNEENQTFKLGYKSVNLGDLTKDVEQLINTLDTI